MFYKGSRYEDVKTASYKDDNEQEYYHKKIRFIKETSPEFEHKVKQNERLDLITYYFYREPTKFWLICDGNNVMHPEEIEIEGKQIIIPEDTF